MMAHNINGEAGNSDIENGQLVLDGKQQKYILGRWNDCNFYPEAEKNLSVCVKLKP